MNFEKNINEPPAEKTSRRDFLSKSAKIAAGLAIFGSEILSPKESEARKDDWVHPMFRKKGEVNENVPQKTSGESNARAFEQQSTTVDPMIREKLEIILKEMPSEHRGSLGFSTGGRRPHNLTFLTEIFRLTEDIIENHTGQRFRLSGHANRFSPRIDFDPTTGDFKINLSDDEKIKIISLFERE